MRTLFLLLTLIGCPKDDATDDSNTDDSNADDSNADDSNTDDSNTDDSNTDDSGGEADTYMAYTVDGTRHSISHFASVYADTTLFAFSVASEDGSTGGSFGIPSAAGTYTCGSTVGMTVQATLGGGAYHSAIAGSSCSVTLTASNPTPGGVMEGTFNGTLYRTDNSGQSITLVDGEFRAVVP